MACFGDSKVGVRLMIPPHPLLAGTGKESNLWNEVAQDGSDYSFTDKFTVEGYDEVTVKVWVPKKVS